MYEVIAEGISTGLKSPPRWFDSISLHSASADDSTLREWTLRQTLYRVA